MAEDNTKEQREAQWWAVWWRADYTWDGLTKKPLEGWVVADGHLREKDTGRLYGGPAPNTPTPTEGRAATLQDYWRADPATGRLSSDAELGDQLVSANDQPTFHRIHLPLVYRDRRNTGKSDWPDAALDDLIGPRLAAAAETAWTGDRFTPALAGRYGRARLDGAVLLAGLSHPQGLSVACDRAAFVRKASFDGATFSGGASFRSATFSEDAGFRGATFSGDAGFSGATFSGNAGFSGATFSGDAGFSGATFSGNASFGNATLSGDLTFHNATFLGDASFNSATFSGEARFTVATFSGNARFGSAAFSGDARFDSGTFSGGASYSSATFSGDANFPEATFSGGASFHNATFSEDARFYSATFSGDANFHNATFSGDARFYRATFSGDARFDRAQFMKTFLFGEATFIRNALFIATKVTGLESGWRGAFSGCLFERLVDWTEARRLPVAAFAGARFDRGLLLSRASDGEDKAAHTTALNEALKPADGDRQAALKALEGGALQIKLALEQASDRLREQRFYRLELLARRKQKGTPWTEKFFSLAYASVSNYGASIGRPLFLIFAMMLAFTMCFFVWAGHLSPVSSPRDCSAAEASSSLLSPSPCPINVIPELWQALDLSWSNTFKPLSALSTENDFEEKNPLAYGLLYDEQGRVDGQGFAVRAVSSLQSILALLLAFLIALAVRRRFQIS